MAEFHPGATLKSGSVILILLAKQFEKVNNHFSCSFGRLRDVLVTNDGRIYLCTSNRETNANGVEIVTEEDDLSTEVRARIKKPPILYLKSNIKVF